MKTAIILEDEAIAARRLKRLLEELFPGEIEVIKTFEAVSDLSTYFDRHPQPDILFLDIMVADGNSFDLFDVVEVTSRVIFITAYDEHAIMAFQKNAVHYLLKPLKRPELEEAVRRLDSKNEGDLNELSKSISPFKERFLIRFASKLHSVTTNSIAYIYSEDKLSFFILKEGSRVPSDIPLQEIMEDLDPKSFYRLNRQFIAHIDSISKMVRHSRSRLRLELNPPSSQEVIISTENTPRFKKWMER